MKIDKEWGESNNLEKWVMGFDNFLRSPSYLKFKGGGTYTPKLHRYNGFVYVLGRNIEVEITFEGEKYTARIERQGKEIFFEDSLKRLSPTIEGFAKIFKDIAKKARELITNN